MSLRWRFSVQTRPFPPQPWRQRWKGFTSFLRNSRLRLFPLALSGTPTMPQASAVSGAGQCTQWCRSVYPVVQVSVPSGAGQCTQRCRSVYPTVQVSVPDGAGQCPQRCRSDFALLTCAKNRHPGPFSGAGPHHQNGPAPFTSLTGTIYLTDRHRSPLPPAPPTPPSCSTYPTDLRHPLRPHAPYTTPTGATSHP